jgi:hypothetical protein
MKQIKVSIPDGVRDLLEAAATKAGRSLSEEARVRVEWTLEADGLDPETSKLTAMIERLAALVELQTGRPWHSHPACVHVLRDAIVARLERLKGDGEAVLNLDELKLYGRPVPAADQKTWGPTLEAIDFHIHGGDK